MPSLKGANLSPVSKLLLIGDSGTGKTGALASLSKKGFRVRILDMDNKIANGILPQILMRDCPDKLESVDFEARRDRFKSSPIGHVFDGQPKAYVEALGLMDKWSDGSSPKDWGPECIFVLDSLTFFAEAAFNWAKSMNPSAKDPRQWYGTAQDGVVHTLSVLTAAEFNTNVIVISHVSYQTRPDGTMKGFPSSVGQAIGPDIPTFFENMALCQIIGGKRQIQTVPTALVDLKTPAAFKMAPAYPIETGLADFFTALRS